MNGSLLTCLLFAQISRWQRLGDGLHRGRGRVELMEMLLLGAGLAAVAIVIAVVVHIRKRNDMSEPCDDPDKLFRELSQAHSLDRASQRLLRRVADAFQLAQPAEVFLQPALLQPEKLPEEFDSDAASLQALQKRLF